MTEKKKQLSHTQRMIIWAVSVRPQTASELALKVGIDVSNIRHAIKKLMTAGLLFSDSAVKKSGQTAKIYKAHAIHPDPRGAVVGRDHHQAPRLELIVDAIKQAEQPLTVQELADATGMDAERVRRAVNYYCHGKHRRLRIASWVYVQGTGYGWTACYCTSNGADAPKPAANTSFSRAEWVKRNKALCQLERQRARVKAGKSSPIYGHVFAQLLSVAGVSPKKAAEQIRGAA